MSSVQILQHMLIIPVGMDSTVLERSTVLSMPFLKKNIYILCTNSSSVICTCIELCGSVVERLLINQSILLFVGSNPDASTLFFSPKPTY